MDWQVWVILPLVGAVGGFLAGMLGVGGGIIFIPVLTWLFESQGIDATETVKYTLANSIFLVFVSGLAGIFRQLKQKSLDWKKVLLIGIPGAIASVIWSYQIQHGTWYHKEDFQKVFLLFLIISIANMLFGKKEYTDATEIAATRGHVLKQIVVALLAGTVVALSGLGGGVIMVPMFRMILKMPMRHATALSLSIIPMLSMAPLISYALATPVEFTPHFQTGYMVWIYALPVATAVAIFASLGLKAAKSIPVKVLRVIFATISLTVFAKTVYDIKQNSDSKTTQSTKP